MYIINSETGQRYGLLLQFEVNDPPPHNGNNIYYIVLETLIWADRIYQPICYPSVVHKFPLQLIH